MKLQCKSKIKHLQHQVCFGINYIYRIIFICQSDQCVHWLQKPYVVWFFSSAQSLGRIWQVCVWHDGAGVSPSWFLNHVMVKDVVHGSSWTFLAQCWLAVDEGDGQVVRKLLALDRQLTFREVNASTTTHCKCIYPHQHFYTYNLKLKCT